MINIKSLKLALLISFILIASIFILFTPKSVSALGCSGASCNGKDPVVTGCNQNSYLAKRFPFKSYPNGMYYMYPNDFYLEVYYSRSCGTNWIRVQRNPFGGNANKWIGTQRYSNPIESDRTYGSSYSMQVYAPGATRVDVWSSVQDLWGREKARVSYTSMY